MVFDNLSHDFPFCFLSDFEHPLGKRLFLSLGHFPTLFHFDALKSKGFRNPLIYSRHLKTTHYELWVMKCQIANSTLQNEPFHRDFSSKSTCFFTQHSVVKNQTQRAALENTACCDGNRGTLRCQIRRVSTPFSAFRKVTDCK